MKHLIGSCPRVRVQDDGRQVLVDLDGVLVIAHSDKEDAAAAWKKTYVHHPLTAFLDHGPGGTGEPVARTHSPTPLETSMPMPMPMPMLAIKGKYRIINTRADGDTVSFRGNLLVG